MAILVKNTTTNEVVKVNNVRVNDGEIVAEWQCNEPGARFYAHYPFLIKTEHTQHHEERGKECRVFELADGFELVTKEKKTRKENTKKQEVKRETKQEETKATETPKDNTPKVQDDDARQLAAILARMKGGNIDDDKVREIVREELGNVAPKQTELTIKTVGGEEIGKVNEPHPLLEKVLTLVKNDRAIGRFPWLHGPAGSGKSTLAHQVADALGLPFYSVSSLLQKYELEGYTDATSNLLETSFFKAFTQGGIFLFDEASTSSAEVQIAFNSALANLIYNFPKVGMCEAHPDFHIIAADNTTGRGGNNTYHARYEVEPSTLDRYTFIEIGYTDAHDLRMAQGDSELVDFIKAVRAALDKANLTYLASPRSSKAVKVYQSLGMDDVEAVWLGLCSGWAKRDIELISNTTFVSGENKYYNAFRKIAARK